VTKSTAAAPKAVLIFIAVFFAITTLIITLSMAANSCAADGGVGWPFTPVTPAEEIEVRTVEELHAVVSGGKGNTYSLMQDIDFDEYVEKYRSWKPIEDFGGVFNGNGYTIRNFRYKPANSAAGFFNQIRAGASVRDLNIGYADDKTSLYGQTVGGIAFFPGSRNHEQEISPVNQLARFGSASLQKMNRRTIS
jgi:hypothetical protein